MRRSADFLFSFRGVVSRRQYLVAALVLVAAKYTVDHTIAAHYGVAWPITAYVLPATAVNSLAMVHTQPQMFWALWIVAIPFFWAGVALTLRRLRDARLQPVWLVLFFIPIANFLLFLTLSMVRSRNADRELIDNTQPEYRPDAPLFGFVLALLLGFALVAFSARYLAQYAWSLFLGVPFVLGFIASWFLNARRLHSAAQTCGASATVVLALGACLMRFKLEGLICLAMAVPLAVPLAIAGGLTARACLRYRAERLRPHTGQLSLCVAILPMLMLVEHHADLQPPVRPVISSVVIDAPVETVWRNVIAFPPLKEPTEWAFRTGIAYPIGATIQGTGIGAVRRCRFSTGDFVEPITVWDEGHLLAFDVAEQPPALSEITWGAGPLHTPHIERNYLRSRHGQFRLVALSANRTLLEGTTWYQDYFWPQAYWRPWSDAIIHRIHLRVLEHVKTIAESGHTPASNQSRAKELQ